MPSNKERVREDLDDRIWGIEGTYIGKEEVKGYDSDEPLYYVKYRPAIDWHRLSIVEKLKIKLGLADLTEKTPEPLPKSQIQEGVPCPDADAVPGVPRKKTVLVSDRDGNARWSDYIDEQLDREARRAHRERNRAQQQQLHEEIDRVEAEHQGRLEEDDRFKKNRSSNNGNGDNSDSSSKVTSRG